MKKILLSLLLTASLSFYAQAQTPVDRETFRGANYGTVTALAVDDTNILSASFPTLTEAQKASLNELFYSKYKTLSTDLTSEELTDLTESMKQRLLIVLGNDIYMQTSQNQALFYRVTGICYLNNNYTQQQAEN